MSSETASRWEPVIGLEVHCELSTETKLFCSCPNTFGDEPNTNVCPVCLGLPGSLPVLNGQAIELAMRIGEALHCEIRASIFHRKNYFYPDMPKDYQVSQYDEPININGWLELADGSRVGIVRAHIEEDTGKTTHVGGGGRIHEAGYSLIDYNRAGVPLVEIVSAPDIRSADQARAYVSELRAILVATGASDGKMEEGSLRVDANVSVRKIQGPERAIQGPEGAERTEMGTRCEIKNMNSLRSLGHAIDYEVARQVALLEAGEQVLQQTRHWNEDEGRTHLLRTKEESQDYRYFPEPDLVPVVPDKAWKQRVRQSMPVLPAARRRRLTDAVGGVGHAEGQTELATKIATLVDLDLDDLVIDAIAQGASPRLALNRAANEAAAEPERARRLDPVAFGALVKMEQGGELSATQAKAVLAVMLAHGGDPAQIARDKGFEALPEEDLFGVLDQVIAAHPDEWERFSAGDAKVAQFLVGKVMKATRGKANGGAVTTMLRHRAGLA